MAKRKRIATSKSRLADIMNHLDGTRVGLTQKEARKALAFVEVLETVCVKKGYASLVLILRRNAKRKAKKIV